MEELTIQQKREKLQKVKGKLKNHFVGIDDTIDKIIENIEVWYLMPELLERPLIINLWGTTGVGKTDLVRRLTKELGFAEKYVEVQLDTGTESNSWSKSTIKNDFDIHGIKETDQAILLLDEIQRFKSIDEQGKTIFNSKYQDIWMLLSDGRFNIRDKLKKNLLEAKLDILYNMDNAQNSPSDGNGEDDEKEKKERKFKVSYYWASYMKRSLELEEKIEEIMQWDDEKKISVIDEKLDELKSMKKGRDKVYDNLLIFISGNIDEAYKISDEVSDNNIDADFYHDYSKNINIITIKNALKKKFKPEQISRFGNTHIIYHVLGKRDFQSLIKDKLSKIAKKVKKLHDIDVTYSKEVYDVIYENGVYPTQGVRPLFSTISSIIENQLPYFIMEAKINNSSKLKLSISDYHIVGTFKGVKDPVKKPVSLDITKLRSKITMDEITCYAVHEAAHAVIFSVLFKKTPLFLISDSSSEYYNGAVVHNTTMENKNSMVNNIKVCLAGLIGEEMVFGKKYRSNGATSDLMEATRIAGRIFRRSGMSDNLTVKKPQETDDAGLFSYTLKDTSNKMDKLLVQQKLETKKILNKNKEFYFKLIDELIKRRRMTFNEFYEIAIEFIPDIEIISDASQKIISNYGELYQNYITKEEDEIQQNGKKTKGSKETRETIKIG